MRKKPSARAIAAHAKKCLGVKPLDKDVSYSSIQGPPYQAAWGEDRNRVSFEISQLVDCCGVAVFAQFHYEGQESHPENLLIEMILAIKKGLRIAKKGHYTKVIATISPEVYQHKKWREALKYCGVNQVGRGSTNPKTGNTIWLHSKTL